MNDVKMDIHIAAPVEKVWAYLSDREKLAEWLMTSDFIPEIGASFSFRAEPAGSWNGVIRCELREIVEAERIAFTWNANDIGTETLVTFELLAEEGGTRLSLRHERFEGARPGAEGRHAAGWTNALRTLQTAVCGPSSEYDWSTFQISFFVEASVAEVFSLWGTAAGLRRFWPDEIEARAADGAERPAGAVFENGDRLSLVFPTGAATELEILNIERDRFLTFRFGENYGWVTVRLSAEAGRTKIVLRQFGLPTAGEAPWEVHANARGWWIFNLMNLKSVLLHGKDLRVRAPGAENGLGALYVPGGEAESPHDWTGFDVFLHVRAAPEAVLASWRTAAGLESFFVGEARFVEASGGIRPADERTATGDAYSWRGIHGFEMKGKIIEASSERVAFSFGSRYAVSVTVAARDDGALLHLHQEGMADEPEDRVAGTLNCRSCWVYFLAALKARLEHGIEIRDLDPVSADAISVGFNR
jgi:uncharacterized protein YndB with AHSA1/START domain